MMLYKHLKTIISVSFFLILSLEISGQGKVKDKEIVLQKNKKITLPKTNKNFEKIIPPKPKKDSINSKFDLSNPFLKTKASIVKPIPIEDKVENTNEITNQSLRAYLRAGFGNYSTTFAEGFFQHRPIESFLYGLNIEHLASRRGPVSGNKSSANENTFRGFFKYFLANQSIDANLMYQQTENSFYGYQSFENLNLTDDEQKQRFRRLGADVTFTNLNINEPIQYDIQAKFLNVSNNFQARETQFSLINQGAYILSENSKINALLDLTFLGRNDVKSESRNYIRLQPSYYLTYGDRLRAEIGANLTFINDTVNNANNVNIYPLLKLSYSITDTYSIEVGLDGQMQKTSLYQISQENPWISSTIPLAHSNQKLRFYGVLRGEIMPKLTFGLRGNYSQFENLYFYTNTVSDSSRFSLAYDTDTRLLNIGVELSYLPTTELRVQLQSDFYNYEVETLEKPWLRPSNETHIIATYVPMENLEIGVDAFVMTGLEGINLESNRNMTMDNIFDISLQADYLFFQKFSAFLSVNNLFSANYQRYLYYPNQGLNFLIGLTYGL